MAKTIYANSALNPHIVHKWTAPASSVPQCCLYCNARCTANLFHLLSKGSYLSDVRARLLSDGPPPASEAAHLERVRTKPSLVEQSAEYALANGLYKFV